MMDDQEDDRLDQSLRDTFSDFDLPPSGHVWRGIEGHLSSLPPPPRTVPLRLLLPAIGLAGVAVGWLLPQPAERPPVARPNITTQASIQPSPQPVVAVPAGSISLATQPADTMVPAPAVGLTASAHLARTRPATALPATQNPRVAALPPQTKAVAPANETQPAASEVALNTATDAAEPAAPQSSAGSPAPTEPTLAAAVTSEPLQDTAAAPTRYATEPSKQSFRPESTHEWRPEYRTPKHRLEERGGRLRRMRNAITKHWQHLFRSRRAGQPSS